MRRVGVVRVVGDAPACRAPRAATSAARPTAPSPTMPGGAARELPGPVPLVGDLAVPRTPGPPARRGRRGRRRGSRRTAARRELGDRVGVAARRAQHRDAPARSPRPTSTLLGSPRHEPISAQRQVEDRALRPKSDSTIRMSAPSAATALGQLLAVQDAERRVLDPRVVARRRPPSASVSEPSPRNGAVTSALGRSATPGSSHTSLTASSGSGPGPGPPGGPGARGSGPGRVGSAPEGAHEPD